MINSKKPNQEENINGMEASNSDSETSIDEPENKAKEIEMKVLKR